jgi:xylulokinase
VLPGIYSLAAGMATSGAVADWLRQLFRGSFASLASVAESMSADSGGLLMLLYFASERNPIFDPNARGFIAGLTLSHRQALLPRQPAYSPSTGSFR